MALFFSRRAYDRSKKQFTNNPSSLTRYVEATASGGKQINSDDWLSKVKAAARSNEVVIYIHGFNTSQKDLLKRLAKVEVGLRKQGYKGAVVAFDWPSDNKNSRYRADRNDAKRVSAHLVTDGIIPLSKLSGKTKVHLLAHSMGAYLTLRAFADPMIQGLGAWSVGQVMFAAADVDQRILERRLWGSVLLKQRSKRFTNYYSGLDSCLDLSGNIIHGGSKRAGRFGLPASVFPKHIDVYCNEQYKKDISTGKRSTVMSHSWWFESDTFFKDVAKTIAGVAPDQMSTRRPTNKADWAMLA